MVKSVDTGRGEGLEPVESVTHAKSRQWLSDYQSKEPCAVNINAHLWRTCYVPDAKLGAGATMARDHSPYPQDVAAWLLSEIA